MIASIILSILQSILELLPIGGSGVVYILGLLMQLPLNTLISNIFIGNLAIGAVLVFKYKDKWIEYLRLLMKVIKKNKLNEPEIHSFSFISCFLFISLISLALFSLLVGVVISTPIIIAIFVLLNAYIVYIGTRVSSYYAKKVDHIHPYQGMIIALFASLGVLPGFSKIGIGESVSLIFGKSFESSYDSILFLAGPMYLLSAIVNFYQITVSVTGAIYFLISVFTAYFFFKNAQRIFTLFLQILIELNWFIGIISMVILKFFS